MIKFAELNQLTEEQEKMAKAMETYIDAQIVQTSEAFEAAKLSGELSDDAQPVRVFEIDRVAVVTAGRDAAGVEVLPARVFSNVIDRYSNGKWGVNVQNERIILTAPERKRGGRRKMTDEEKAAAKLAREAAKASGANTPVETTDTAPVAPETTDTAPVAQTGKGKGKGKTANV